MSCRSWPTRGSPCSRASTPSPRKATSPSTPRGSAHAKTLKLLAAWHDLVSGDQLFEPSPSTSTSIPCPTTASIPSCERHYVSSRSRRQPSILVFLAQDAEGRAFCYSNADLRKGEEAEEIFRFVDFWKRTHGALPRHLVFDSKLTTYDSLARLDEMGIPFITLRRRSPKLLQEIANLPRSAWRTIELDVPTRKFRTPRVYRAAGRPGRALVPPVLHPGSRARRADHPAHQRAADARPKIITRYAQRMLIENALSDAVRFFHMDALSSAVGLKVDFDMAPAGASPAASTACSPGACAATPTHRRARSSATSSTCRPTSRSPQRRSWSASTAAHTCRSFSRRDSSTRPSLSRGGATLASASPRSRPPQC